MEYFYKLKIPGMGHPPGFTLPEVRPFDGSQADTDSWILKVEDLMDKKTIAFFKKECHLIFDKCYIFFIRAGCSTNIHIDGTARDANVWAVNFIQNGIGSKINWYNKTKVHPGTSEPRCGGSLIDTWEEKDLTLARTLTVNHDKLLIRTDAPHKVINCSDNSRWCFSFRGNSRLHKIKSWDEIVKSFKKYI